VEQPFEVEEWRYYIAGKLIGIGYVDAIERDDLPAAEKDSSGLSAIYFFYDPDYRDLSLGTWNVLRLIEEAQRRQMGYLYLGFFVEGCRSMQYKARFVPNEIRERDGQWRLFRD
jgi:arginine-tRNA-protein transferase